MVTIPALELALDDQIPPSWPRIDALKLSVNGAERNTLVLTSESSNSRLKSAVKSEDNNTANEKQNLYRSHHRFTM